MNKYYLWTNKNKCRTGRGGGRGRRSGEWVGLFGMLDGDQEYFVISFALDCLHKMRKYNFADCGFLDVPGRSRIFRRKFGVAEHFDFLE